MIDLITSLFSTLMGSEIFAVISLILAFSLVSSLVGKLLEVMQIKGSTWSFAVKVCIGYMAVAALGGFQCTLSLS